jgi:hypothetical protein
VLKFTNVEMCRITEELIFQEPYQVDTPAQPPTGLTDRFGCCMLVFPACTWTPAWRTCSILPEMSNTSCHDIRFTVSGGRQEEPVDVAAAGRAGQSDPELLRSKNSPGTAAGASLGRLPTANHFELWQLVIPGKLCGDETL